jgi:hypothetical protein
MERSTLLKKKFLKHKSRRRMPALPSVRRMAIFLSLVGPKVVAVDEDGAEAAFILILDLQGSATT